MQTAREPKPSAAGGPSRMTVRFQLTIGSIAVIVVANSILSLVMVLHLGRVWLQEVQNRVRLDLNSARSAYRNHIATIEQFLRAASLSSDLAWAAQAGDRSRVAEIVQRIRAVGRMDFVSLLDSTGQVVCRATNLSRFGDDLSHNPIVSAVLRTGEAMSGSVVMSQEELAAESHELAQRARFELLPTPAAKPTEDKVRTDGMVVAAAVPVLDSQDQLVGILFAGDLLNRRYEIVDTIKQDVFFGERWGEKDLGTVTIFQGDLRISTNVRRDDGSRAVGTRLSAAVADAVLVHGSTWAAPAFVVNDWYITAYEPIRNPTGKIIGSLYVGLLQAPFLYRRNMLAVVFLGMVFAATLASLLLLTFTSKLVLHPIGQIIKMVRQVIKGDLTARVGIRPPGEMGLLCEAIDNMAEAVAAREYSLELSARKQIGRSEQLASIGRLAAGVAHEINNPLTGVLTFAHLLREKENMDDQDRQDLDLIIRETTRAAEIVRGLLDFARERPAVKEPFDVNEVIRRTIRLLGNQKAFQQINIVDDLGDDLPRVQGDVNQIQQVLLNLCLNACEAMPNGGTLLIATWAADEMVLIKVGDTGCGIRPEHLDRIFEPFFSTKPVGKGTGLGLSVTYGIVEQHGGSIEVESIVGKGTTFTVALPAASTAPLETSPEKTAS